MMGKEFDKWWDKYSYYCEWKEEGVLRETVHDAWKAALEWVLSRVQYSNSDGSIIYYIEEELNDG